jgi:hypothetical protein
MIMRTIPRLTQVVLLVKAFIVNEMGYMIQFPCNLSLEASPWWAALNVYEAKLAPSLVGPISVIEATGSGLYSLYLLVT